MHVCNITHLVSVASFCQKQQHQTSQNNRNGNNWGIHTKWNLKEKKKRLIISPSLDLLWICAKSVHIQFNGSAHLSSDFVSLSVVSSSLPWNLHNWQVCQVLQRNFQTSHFLKSLITKLFHLPSFLLSHPQDNNKRETEREKDKIKNPLSRHVIDRSCLWNREATT